MWKVSFTISSVITHSAHRMHFLQLWHWHGSGIRIYLNAHGLSLLLFKTVWIIIKLIAIELTATMPHHYISATLFPTKSQPNGDYRPFKYGWYHWCLSFLIHFISSNGHWMLMYVLNVRIEIHMDHYLAYLHCTFNSDFQLTQLVRLSHHWFNFLKIACNPEVSMLVSTWHNAQYMNAVFCLFIYFSICLLLLLLFFLLLNRLSTIRWEKSALWDTKPVIWFSCSLLLTISLASEMNHGTVSDHCTIPLTEVEARLSSERKKNNNKTKQNIKLKYTQRHNFIEMK